MLLKTRFYLPPLREQSVFRHHLIEKLNSSSGGQLILVSAPAGYGKTTVVSQWLHSTPHTFSWLTLDSSQSSADVLWEHIIGALQKVQPDIGKEAVNIIKNADDYSLEAVVISLLNDLDELCTNNNSQNPITLILDDFHRIENPTVLHLMSLFLDHLPPSIRMVLTARKEPALALPRRRASNQLLELNERDLAFSLDEGRDFFNDTMKLSLNDPEIRNLFDKSEGWVVGLQLAALTLKKTSLHRTPPIDSSIKDSPSSLEPSSLNRHISDYLFDEVFSQQTEVLQRFLIITSCVPRFCAGLCNSLLGTQLGTHASLALITQLDQSNLFLVPLDNHRTWFRYHDLFRQFLSHHFANSPADLVNNSYQISAQWFEDAGYLEEALDQFILLKDWRSSGRLLEQISLDKIQQGHKDSLINWIEKIPDEFITPLQLPALPLSTSPSTPPLNPQNAAEITSATLDPLTRRESQVMELVSRGLPNKQIASELHISLNTLKVHIRNLYGKMGVENRTQALLKINQHNNP